VLRHSCVKRTILAGDSSLRLTLRLRRRGPSRADLTGATPERRRAERCGTCAPRGDGNPSRMGFTVLQARFIPCRMGLLSSRRESSHAAWNSLSSRRESSHGAWDSLSSRRDSSHGAWDSLSSRRDSSHGAWLSCDRAWEKSDAASDKSDAPSEKSDAAWDKSGRASPECRAPSLYASACGRHRLHAVEIREECAVLA
jgi:hypothetical protein